MTINPTQVNSEKDYEMITAARRQQNTSGIPTTTPRTRLAGRDQTRPLGGLRKRAICATAAAALAIVPNLAAAASLLDGITGSWSGRGTVTFEGGNSENLSCRSYYTSSGSLLSIAIRCASTSYKTEIRSKLLIANGSLAGDWEERNFNAVGSASGAISGNTIVLRISGAIEGRLVIDQTGSRQSVTIVTNGGGLSSVKIGLSKS